ncbi:hypothetical protein [Ruminococcus flavefaciens]|uniref:TIR domain-containing protein n=2 Tax=Ruminococcus flavefaciens TaxID=1265 RepID=W7UVM4_RUMFL|nr:hypothetical protein [Ruminococcus flavefaciens]EWM55209.1 hypothetical protein RF007C_04445 [Ruminococcus flavefaciens 007c]
MDFMCKMCGGIISPDDDTGVCECEHCGSRQTYPLRYFGEYAEMYNRACELRFKTDFEGAEKLFRRLTEEMPEESEGYWGLVMCRCGVEYEDDPISGMKIPVFGGSALGDITADDDYRNAVAKAAPVQGAFYRREAAALEMLRRERTEQVGTGEKYDVFICCRITDEKGTSTVDSVIADEIYHQLTREGMRVFYAPGVLGDMPEKDTEPYVNAAIAVAGVYLIVAASAESFGVPRLKSEWSRCAAAAKKDSSKQLFVCIRNTDPRDIPDELRRFTVKDVTRMGFLSEVIRSIYSADQSRGTGASRNTPEKLIRRMKIFLGDEDFDAAEEYSDLILDADPKCWQAHYVRFLAYNGCRNSNDLLNDSTVQGFAYDYAERFGYDISDDEFFRAQLEDVFGDSMRRALKYSEGEDRVRMMTLYERLISAVRDAVFACEQEKVEAEEQEELDELRRQHSEKESSRAAAKRKKQLIRSRFLGYMAAVLSLLFVLAIKFHCKWAIVLIVIVLVVSIAVLAGLER